jgi:orotidine-5'-phosphate decarboxylase
VLVLLSDLDPRRRLAFPLDYPDLDAARRGAALVAQCAGVLKIGLELFVREGPRSVAIADGLDCDTFLDLKLHDIPATVERAVASASARGARYLTIHASGGPTMVEAAVRRAETEGSGLRILAVTVLTSLDRSDLAATGVSGDPAEQVRRLAQLAWGAGARGFVCSAAEAAGLRRALGADAILVTPGIRPDGPTNDDQKRTGTPAQAIADGATILVVGRPIRDAADPAAAARSIMGQIAEAARSPRRSLA